MGLFDRIGDGDVILENADLDCEPQNEYVSKTRAKKMDEFLDPGEKVHFMAMDAGGGLKIDGEKQDGYMNIITVATDQRILFRSEKVIGSKQTSIDYENVASVEVSFGMVQKRLNLETDSKVFGIGVGQIDKEEVQDMAQFVREKAREAGQSSAGDVTNESDNEEDPLDKLERLGNLRDDGVITEDEFQEKKQSLLDQI